MEGKIQELNQEFNKTIQKRFSDWAAANDKETTPEELINFLIGSSLVTEPNVVRYMAVYCYPRFLEVHNGKKMRALYSLENILPRGLTQIQSIIKHYSKHFRYNKNLIE